MPHIFCKTVLISGALLSLLASVPVFASDGCGDGVEKTAIPFSTPSSDFVLHGDGTVTHTATGLMWMRCSLGQSWNGSSCTGSAADYSWADALAQSGTSFAGYSDWRLPNKNELASIVEQRCMAPAINAAVFPAASDGWFWSSSPNANDSHYAWGVYFFRGYVGGDGNKDDLGHVRLVRAGQ